MRCVRLVMMALACLLALDASAGQPDKRVRKALDRLKLNYEVDEDADFKLLFNYGDRTQLVWVGSSTDEYGDLEVRRVFSYGIMVPDGQKLPDDVYRQLANGGYKIGGWSVQDGRVAVFSQALDARAKPKVLLAALQAVAETADDIEIELTDGGDEL